MIISLKFGAIHKKICVAKKLDGNFSNNTLQKRPKNINLPTIVEQWFQTTSTHWLVYGFQRSDWMNLVWDHTGNSGKVIIRHLNFHITWNKKQIVPTDYLFHKNFCVRLRKSPIHYSICVLQVTKTNNKISILIVFTIFNLIFAIATGFLGAYTQGNLQISPESSSPIFPILFATRDNKTLSMSKLLLHSEL